MIKKIKRKFSCTFCIESFEKSEIWWVDLKMNRNDPSSSLYSAPSCEKCMKSEKNSPRIFGSEVAEKMKK